jgi:uncharacterized metal-binding protein YceD (DUF177 family)
LKKLREYVINFGNLKPGTHDYSFSVNEDFFSEFEYSLVKKGEIEVQLVLEKQKETLLILNFELKGYIVLECDRCLDEYEYPIDSKHRILVKLDTKETESEDDLIFLPIDAYELDVRPLIYEFINLSLPLKKTCEEVGKTCNPKMLDYLDHINDKGDSDSIDPRWEELKRIKDKNN